MFWFVDNFFLLLVEILVIGIEQIVEEKVQQTWKRTFSANIATSRMTEVVRS